MFIDPHIPTGLNEFLRDFRRKNRLTQKDLSQMMKVNPQSLSHWENKKAFPSRRYFPIFENILDISSKELFKMKEKMHSYRKHISMSFLRDPVVSTLTPRYVPMFDKETDVLPLEMIKFPEKWPGKRCFLPDDLFPGRLFGFEISDDSMQPHYQSGEIVLVDLKPVSQEKQAVIIKIKRRSPLCRFHLRRGAMRMLSSSYSGDMRRIPKNHIEWCYPIMRSLGKNPVFLDRS